MLILWLPWRTTQFGIILQLCAWKVICCLLITGDIFTLFTHDHFRNTLSSFLTGPTQPWPWKTSAHLCHTGSLWLSADAQASFCWMKQQSLTPKDLCPPDGFWQSSSYCKQPSLVNVSDCSNFNKWNFSYNGTYCFWLSVLKLLIEMNILRVHNRIKL